LSYSRLKFPFFGVFCASRLGSLADSVVEHVIILIKEINKPIKSLLNGKALGLDNILNKVLKVIALVITKDLAKAASYFFINRIISKSLKEFIMVVLRKEGKKNYSLLSSYRLITLKNILTKVLKKYIANIISKAVEKYRLFP